MPRAWYIFTGLQTQDDYNELGKYQLSIDENLNLVEPTCNSSNDICAIYAIGNLVGSPPVQSNNPTNIDYPKSFFASAIGTGASYPLTGGNNAQGRPYYVRVKS